MRTLIVLLCLFVLGLGDPVSSQISRRGASPKEIRVLRATERPDLAIDFALVAKLKLASRKTTYRLGDMITIDMALMNPSGGPVFLYDLKYPVIRLKAIDVEGKPASVRPYAEEDVVVLAESFVRVDPYRFLDNQMQVLAGHDVAASRRWEKESELIGLNEPEYSKARFDRDLFINYGNAWLDAKPGGTYTVTAEYENDSVIVNPDNPKMKTATGRIVSSPLTISISE